MKQYVVKSKDIIGGSGEIKLLICSSGDPSKIMGELSKNALWVKENDEFDEDEIMHYFKQNDYCTSTIDFYDKTGGFPYDYTIRVKGMCGHYH